GGFISGYRGSPLGTYDQELWRAKKLLEQHDIVFQPGVNEDLAATAVWGTQMLSTTPKANKDGVFAIWYGKGPGVDRSGDPMKHGNVAGTHVHGGVLIVAGDDHSGKSSTVAHQSEIALMHVGMPILAPADVQDVIDFGLLGFAMSRYTGLYTGFKLCNEVLEQTMTVEVNDRPEFVLPDRGPAPPNGFNNFPSHLDRQQSDVVVKRYRWPLIAKFVRANHLDKVLIDAPERRLGLIATGKAVQDTIQALKLLELDRGSAAAVGISFYKLGCMYPIESSGLTEFAARQQELLVIEEKEALVEPQVKALLYGGVHMPRVVGKTDETGEFMIPRDLQLEPIQLALVIVERLRRLGVNAPALYTRAEQLSRLLRYMAPVAPDAVRSPYFCSGCPHNTSTRVPSESIAAGGIGCHSMAMYSGPAMMPNTQMGGEGGHWYSLAHFSDMPHVFQNMGDGTYYHSGLLAIRGAVAAKVNMTFKVLFNDAVAMTGGQPVDGPLTPGDVTKQVMAEGAARCVVVTDRPELYGPHSGLADGVTVHHRNQLDAIQRELREVKGVTVIVYAEETLNKLKGVCESLRHVETLRKQGVPPPKGALLFGPPGTGKTQIARTLANESGLPFIAATTADLKAGFTGQSGQKVRELFDRARGRAPCILFIDEIDAVAPPRGGPGSDQFTIEIVNQLLQEMDGVKQTDRHVYVLAATNRLEAVDAAVRSRLKDTIEIPNPDRAQREQLFRVFLSRMKTEFDVAVVAAELAGLTNNIGGRAISAIVERASQEASNRAIAARTPENVVLTREDLMREARPQGKEVSDADLDKIWSRIVLKPMVKADLLDKIRMFNRGDKAAPKGLLLYGPPGTGKTEIARRIADSASCFFMSLTTPDLKAGFVGQTGERVKKVWEQARGRGRCVMFIDECEGVFARRGGSNSDGFSEELVQAFLAEWDGLGTEGQQVWVIGATNRRDLLDDAIVSRFGAAVQIDLPDAPERLQILQFEMEKLERAVPVPSFLGQLTTGMSGRNLARIASEVCTLAAKQGGEVTDDMWREVLKRHTQASSEAVDDGARWNSLVLSTDVLEKLQTLCESLRNVEEFKAQGFDVPKGALLFGPPGTGKTQIARTLANESGLPFIAATTADLKAGYVGQAGQRVRELFERARGRAPCIVFIDEIEAVAPARGGAGADVLTGEIVNQLLQEMDGVKKSERHVFVLAATNLPNAVDAAVLSRFGDQIEIPHPDVEQRTRLVQVFLGKLPIDFDRNAAAIELAEATDGLGGRDLRSLIQKASQKAIRRAGGSPRNAKLTREDLLSSVTASPPRPVSPNASGERRPLH
ncbi:MAG: AAA family ATPase, partial [Steroidobacteraceae bacterium]